ncbi:hypothetical protein IE53DRAFT_71553 [Violaceomyces palustris]|uniref:Uncharacterized protein n=1 Tax=Violaceomyces palustris TaxID=1673888 RepID=A0ACD0P7N2_9BASI|nr:hypothetical protein IE53DRAFT_71553 [Violaceomyces palustris]
MTSSSMAGLGLGIDFGGPVEQIHAQRLVEQNQRQQRQHQGRSRPRTAHEPRDRYTALPSKSSFSSLRRPTAADARLEARRVRIASGEPGILGHGAGHTSEDDVNSPGTISSCTSSSYASSASEDIIMSSQRSKRLSDAVAAMSDSQYDSSSPEALSSSNDDYSPRTETSVTSISSGASSQKRRNKLKKQMSQPNLSRTVTTKLKNQNQESPPTRHVAMNRSMSSISLSSAYKSDGSSSLGRSSEIPRGGNRTARGAGRGRGRGGSGQGGQSRPQTWNGEAAPAPLQSQNEKDLPNPSHLIPDGFGGYTSVEQAEYQSKPPSVLSLPTSMVSSSTREGQNCFDGPSLVQQSQQTPSDNGRALSDAGSTKSTILRQRQRAQSMYASLPSLKEQSETALYAPQWKVGSFYGANGQETGRINDEGKISLPASVKLSQSEARNSVSMSSESSAQSRTGRPRSQSGPRAHLMSSPSQAAGVQEEQLPEETMQMQRSRSSTSIVPMRSMRGWRGLEGAERGESMISLDSLNNAFEAGEAIRPDRIKVGDSDSIIAFRRQSQVSSQGVAQSRTMIRASTDMGITSSVSSFSSGDSQIGRQERNSLGRSLSEANVSNASMLERQGTLLSTTGNPARKSRELNRLLGNSGRKLPASAAATESIAAMSTDSLASTKSGLSRSNAIGSAVAPPAILEQGKAGKARVEVDLVLESDLVVEGGMLKGRMQIKVRKGNEKEGAVMLAQPKVRVVGFEELIGDDTRHIFYHHASVIDGDRSLGGPSQPYFLHGSPTLSSPEGRGHFPLPCFASSPDVEGYSIGREGCHSIPFSLELPIAKGAKGSYRGKSALVRYIVIGSVKLKSSGNTNRSIAHFYRHVELFPYLNPAIVLSSAPRLIQASASKGLFLGGSGKVKLTASLHRSTWVAGQRVYVNLAVVNETSKKINSLTLGLIRTVTLFRPRPELNMGQDAYVDPDACSTNTTRKKISEESLEMGQKGSKGSVTARGWWTGIEPGGSVDFSHYMNLPSEALSISRGRHVEVAYTIKVSVGSSLSSDVSVELPLRIINFVSLDPPPIKTLGSKIDSSDAEGAALARTWSQVSARALTGNSSSSERPMIERVRSMDALRSPAKVEVSLNGQNQPNTAQLVVPPQPDDEASRNRRLQHQKSLDFINHAIRSATARRGPAPGINLSSAGPSPLGLGIEVPDDAPADFQESDGGATPTSSSNRAEQRSLAQSSAIGPIHPSCLPYEQPLVGNPIVQGPGLPLLRVVNAVTLDEVGDDFDEEDRADRTLVLNDESVDEVDMVIGSTQLDRGSSPHFLDVGYSVADDPDLSASFDEMDAQERYQDGDDQTDDLTRYYQESLEEEEEERVGSGVEDSAGEERVDNNNGGWSMRKQSEDLDSEDEAKKLSPTRPEARGEAFQDTRPLVIRKDDMDTVRAVVESPGKDQGVTPNVPRKNLQPPIPSIKSTPPVQKPKEQSLIHRISTNFETKAKVVHSPSSNASRPSSPVKTAGLISPRKSALKSKSSFTFATGDSPLKLNKQATQNFGQAEIRAKVAPSQMAPPLRKAASQASLHDRLETLSKKDSAIAGAQEALKGSKKGTPDSLKSERSSNQGQGKKTKKSRKSKSPKLKSEKKDGGSASQSSTPATSHSDGFSSAASSVGTPETISQELPRIEGDETALKPPGSMSPLAVPFVPKASADAGTAKRKIINNLNGQTQTSGKSIGASVNEKVVPSLRHSVSTSALTNNDRLQRSHSTHNLRGSAVVVPSVRNKIAMLENRNQALKDFTGAGAAAGASPARNVISSEASTPMGTPLRGIPAGEGRVAQLAASAEKGKSETNGSSRLSRKASILSVASSEDSFAQPDYLKRTNSVMSFKAPMLRNIKG